MAPRTKTITSRDEPIETRSKTKSLPPPRQRLGDSSVNPTTTSNTKSKERVTATKSKGSGKGTRPKVAKAEKGKGTSKSSNNIPKSSATKKKSESEQESATEPSGQDPEHEAISPENVEPAKPIDEEAPGSRAGSTQVHGNSGVVAPSHDQDKDGGGHGANAPSNGKRKSIEQGVGNTDPPAKSPKLSPDSDVHTNSLRKLETIQEFTSAGWQISNGLPKYICCVDGVNRSRFPSPLAEMGNQQARTLHFVNNHSPDQVRRLYNLIRSDKANYRREIIGAFEDAQGVFVEARPRPHMTTKMHKWPTGDASLDALLDPVFGGRLEACTIDRTEEHQPGHFISIDNQLLTINDSIFGQGLLVGPLPEFAIIQLGQRTLFWWRSIEALDYVPNGSALVSGQPRLYSNEQQLSSPVRDNWAYILQYGLEHNRRQIASRIPFAPDYVPLRIPTPWNLSFDNTLLAIAPIWDGLRKKKVIYAFGGDDVFESNMAGLVRRFGVVGGARKFIMPLFFPANPNADEEAQEIYKAKQDPNRNPLTESVEPAVGHIALASAERLSQGLNGVRIDIFDSLKGAVRRDEVEGKALTLAYRSGWEGCRNTIRPPPFYNLVPRQPRGTNTCGIFTILNAWAVMLEIPLRRSQHREGRRSDQECLRVGLELVNLALAGFMDSRTIQAYLNVYGLCERQDPTIPVTHQVNATRMNQRIFGETLAMQLYRDRGILAPSLTPDREHGTGASSLPSNPATGTQGPSIPPKPTTGTQVSSPPPNPATGTKTSSPPSNPQTGTQAEPTQFPEENIAILMAGGTTRKDVLEALNRANGNMEWANIILQDERSPPLSSVESDDFNYQDDEDNNDDDEEGEDREGGDEEGGDQGDFPSGS